MSLTNTGITFTVKNPQGTQTPLYPRLKKENIMGYNVGEIYGPYFVQILKTDWDNDTNIATVFVNHDVPRNEDEDNAILYCAFDGKNETIPNTIKLKKEYDKITDLTFEKNKVFFHCKETPKETFDVQIWYVV